MVCDAWGEEEQRVADIIQRLQEHAFPRRVRCREFFREYDSLRQGRCTIPHFARAVSRMGVDMTEAEYDLLGEHFTDHSPKVHKPQVFDYVEFCRRIDEVFGNEGMQEQMFGKMTFSPGSTMMSTFQQNTTEDEDRAHDLLQKIAALCKSRGTLIKPIFTDLDRAAIPTASRTNPRRGGKVTKAQFIRNWPFKKEFTEDDLELLCLKYSTKGGDVHYMALHNEVAEVMQEPASYPAQPFPTSPLNLRPDNTEWSHSSTAVVTKIRAKVAEKKARLREFFQDFDPLRKGFCTPGQLKTVFTIMNVSKDIDKMDFEALLEQYGCDDGRFCYRDFCADVDSAFTTPGLEKSPLATIDMPDKSTTAAARRNTIRLSAAKSEKIRQLEDRVTSQVVKQRIEMKPVFQDFDKCRRGFVTRSQFQRIMATMSITVDERQVGLFCQQYCDNGNHNDFNYVRFLKSVDPLSEEVEMGLVQLQSPHKGFKPTSYFDHKGTVLAKSVSMPSL